MQITGILTLKYTHFFSDKCSETTINTEISKNKTITYFFLIYGVLSVLLLFLYEHILKKAIFSGETG